MRLSEIIIRRKIRRIIQEAVGGVPTSTATGRSTYTAALVSGKTGDLSFSEKVTRIVLGAIGLRVLWGIAERALDPSKTTPEEKKKLTMHATVCGDSQANGSLGAAVAAQLKTKGYTVTRVGDDGARPSVVLTQVQAAAKDSVLVVAIFGGNSPSPGDAASNLTKMYDACEKSGAAFMAIGPPPPTKILDTQRASTVFSTTITDPDHWLKLPDSANKSPDFRRAVSDAMQGAKSGSEDINVWGIASNMSYPGDYEDQPDGIHCVNGADEVARRALEGLRIDEATTEIKKTIEDAQRKGPRPKTKRQYSSTADTEADMMLAGMGAVDTGDIDMAKYRVGIIKVESGGNIGSRNPETNASGKYQFVPSVNTPLLLRQIRPSGNITQPTIDKANAEYKKVKSGSNKFSDYFNNTSSGIRACWDYMLTDEALQDRMLDEFTSTQASEAKSVKTANPNDPVVSALSIAQITAAMHLHGSQGFKDQVVRDRWFGPPKKRDGTLTKNHPLPIYIDIFSQGYYGSDF
jgi:hypothetical protein